MVPLHIESSGPALITGFLFTKINVESFAEHPVAVLVTFSTMKVSAGVVTVGVEAEGLSARDAGVQLYEYPLTDAAPIFTGFITQVV